MKKFFQKSILNPIVDLLKQGLTPEKLAMSLSAGIVISCFPVLGSTTILCAIFAHVFKLNHVGIQLANYVCYPLQFLLLIPFFILGNKIFGYDQMVFSIDDMLTHFQIDPLGFFETYIGLALRACVAWAVTAPFVGFLIYYPLKILLLKFSRRHMTAMLICFLVQPVFADVMQFSGTAKNTKGEIVYTEKHKVTMEKEKLIASETLYYSKNNELIAELKSDYRESMFLPTYTFKDFRNGIEHVVERSGDRLILKSKENSKAEFKSKEIKADSNMVSCQGFHYFIKENLSNFEKNENRDIQLILPGLLDYFTFNIRAQNKSDMVGPIVKLKMTVNSWLLKVFVSNVHIEYDRSKKHLVSYSGASNILTDSGDTQDVVITYQY